MKYIEFFNTVSRLETRLKLNWSTSNQLSAKAQGVFKAKLCTFLSIFFLNKAIIRDLLLKICISYLSKEFITELCFNVLQVNPFKDRICQVFSSNHDGNMTFEDFLDMMSVFSDNAPKSVKVEYAFRIYGRVLL